MASVDIVLVEDNRHDIEMILDAFREHGMTYNIAVLNDGVKGIDYFFDLQGCFRGTPAELPKLILLDLKFPKVNGIEVLKRLKSAEQTRHVPIVVFTSSNEYRDKLESYSLGVNSYIVKPLDSEKFSRSVADIGSYWVLMNTAPHDGT